MMHKKKIGTLEVSALGLGCMGMSEFYGTRSEERSQETLQAAYEKGITFFDTADMYGMGENEKLVGRTIQHFRDKIIIATKFGIVRNPQDPQLRGICGKPAYVRKQCEASLKRLGIETIDLYYQHRVDPETPIEDTIGEMSKLVHEGKVRHLGLSEASPEIIRRAHKVHPITALQSEYSLWTRDPENGVMQTCRELNIGFVAFSPIGRGFLSGRFKDPKDLPDTDYRKQMPRFQEENFKKNLDIVEKIKEIALQKKCTPAQLALAWVIAQAPFIVPIFGTTSPKHLQENIDCLNVQFTKDELHTLKEKLPNAQGERYPQHLAKALQSPSR